MLNRSSDFLQRARGAPEAESWFTSVELQNLDDQIVETQVSVGAATCVWGKLIACTAQVTK